MKTRRIIVRVAVFVLCWYGLVYLIGGCASPNHARWRAIQTRVLSDAKQIEHKRFTLQELAEAIGKLKLEWSMTTFRPVTTFQSETNWTIRLEPSPTAPYNAPVWWRVALLDFSRARFKTVTVGANEDAQQAESTVPVKAPPSAPSPVR